MRLSTIGLFNSNDDDAELMVFDSLTDASRETSKHFHAKPDCCVRSLGNCWGRVDKLGRSDIVRLRSAVEATQHPWLDGIAIVRSMLKELMDTKAQMPTVRKRRQFWSDESGMEIDFDRYRRGDPFWRTSKRANKRTSKNKTIISDLSTNWDVDAKPMLWRGAAAICLAYILERAGYRCAFWVSRCSHDTYVNGRGLVTMIRVKDYGHPLNIGAIASSVSGWFFRTICFAMGDIYHVKQCRDLGCAFSPRSWHLDVVEPKESDRIAVSDIWTRDEAVECVKNTVEQLG